MTQWRQNKVNSSNCRAFNNSTWWEQWLPGYFLDTGACIKQETGNRCAINDTSDNSKCFSCYNRTYPNASSLCDDISKNPCSDPNCEFCTSATSCHSCITGFGFDGTTCVAFNQSALGNCSWINPATNTCKRCHVGSFIKNGICTPSGNATLPWSSIEVWKCLISAIGLLLIS